jgi:cysteinyl-tRNA synthetase
MDDDFNTAQGISVLFELARTINQAADAGGNIDGASKALKALAGEVMGLRLPPSEATADSVQAAPFIELLIKTRFDLRQAKQYKLADEIRAKLSDLGILLDDTPTGTVWRARK